jgi:hypothetical protein
MVKKDTTVENVGGTPTIGEQTPPQETKFQLSEQELDDIRGMMAKSAEKDRIIADLQLKTEVLSDELAKKSDAPVQRKPGERKITTYYCRLHKFEDKWVLGWTGTGVYRETNTRGEKEEYLNLIIKGMDKPVKMRFLDYINDLPQVVVKIKEKRKLPDTVKDYGEVEKVVYDEKSGLMIGLGYSVPSEVITENYEYVVELDGEEVVISERFIN